MVPLKPWKKVLDITLAVLFFLFAYVQLNDPDPVIWFFVYFIVGLLALISAFRPLPMLLLYLVFAGLVLFSGLHFPYLIEWLVSEDPGDLFGEMTDDKYYIEGTREFLGLLIAIAAVVYLMVQNRRR